VRGSRRSIATRPLGIAPDASRSRRLRYEKAAGPFAIPSASEGSARIPNSSVWSGSPHGALTLRKSCSSPNQPAGGAPTTSPDRSRDKPKRTFRQTIRPQGCPQDQPLPARSAALRREESGSTGRRVLTRDAWPSIPFASCARQARARRTQHRTIGAPCGRQSPADSVCFPVLLACTRPLDKPKPTQGTGQPGNPSLSRIEGSV
jgi:hypothetical protein